MRGSRAIATAAVVVAALAACSSSATSITPPKPSAAAASACRSLDAQLPGRVDGTASSSTTPQSPFTAAWGDIVLTCGGSAPQVASDAQLFTIEGVDWFPERLPQGGTRFSTVGRVATVTVLVPATRQPEANALVDLGPAVRSTVSTTPTTATTE